VVRDRKKGDSVKILFSTWDVVDGRVVKTDKRWDIAVIAIAPVDIKPVVFAKLLRKGEKLTIHGYGKGYPASATGIFNAFRSPGGKAPQDWIEIVGVEARQGDSGGAILNASGEYVGTLFGSGDGFTIGTHAKRVREILGTLLQDYDLTTATP
jgi:S1-C subfamily serine protease